MSSAELFVALGGVVTGVVVLYILGSVLKKNSYSIYVLRAKLLHALFDVHSPSGLELQGCSRHGWRSRKEYLKDLDTSYEAGFRAGRLLERTSKTINTVENSQKGQ